MLIAAISGDIFQMGTQYGCGVVQAEIIGPDATRVRVLPARVVHVIDATRPTVRQQRTTSVVFWRISDLDVG